MADKHISKAAKPVRRDTTTTGAYLEPRGKSEALAGRTLDSKTFKGVAKESGHKTSPGGKYAHVEERKSGRYAAKTLSAPNVKSVAASSLSEKKSTPHQEPVKEAELWNDEYTEFFQPYLDRVSGKGS